MTLIFVFRDETESMRHLTFVLEWGAKTKHAEIQQISSIENFVLNLYGSCNKNISKEGDFNQRAQLCNLFLLASLYLSVKCVNLPLQVENLNLQLSILSYNRIKILLSSIIVLFLALHVPHNIIYKVLCILFKYRGL